ncbi:unnamed protein product [Fusarium graminearum]|uniref:Chromosome 2, complete genome n=1 Tax=Gibberella zeae (strain ATCC MYA-4620 / CBS 123657 / FGSC 9075 / NRRL 31084 / PH-1) TaxID=229533 RepID=A0A1C3YN35_GIBZE|nr:unnamed protein product [Fusarium graminearum]
MYMAITNASCCPYNLVPTIYCVVALLTTDERSNLLFEHTVPSLRVSEKVAT